MLSSGGENDAKVRHLSNRELILRPSGDSRQQICQKCLDINRLRAQCIGGDGVTDECTATTDGLLVLRYLLGLRGSALISNAVAANALRTKAVDIEAFQANLLP